MLKKLMALILCIITVTASLTLVSCKKEEEKTEETTVSTQAQEETDYLETLEAPSFGEGEEFVIYQFGTATIAAGQTFEQVSGEPICDSIYYRDRALQERYGVKLVYEGACRNSVSIAGKTVETIEKQTMSQLDQVDLWEFSIVNASKLLYGGDYFLPLNSVKYVNMENEWWASDANNHLSINGKIFTGTGDVSLSYYGMPFCLAINKKIASEQQIDTMYGKNVYDLVRDDEWTYEKMIAMSLGAAKDLDGDLAINPEDDQYGFQYDMGCGYAFLTSIGLSFSKVENGLPVVDMTSDSITTAADWIRQNLGGDSTHSIGGYTKDTEITQIFSSGRSLFGSAQISHIASKMRNYNFNFGIVPMPKESEEQDNYYSYANIYYAAYMGVPSYAQNTDKVGFILEAMAYKSYNSVRGTYIETSVKDRANSADDSEMLGVVLDTIYYDLNLVMNFGNTREIYLKYIHGSIEGYTSNMTPANSLAQTELGKYIQSFS